MGERGRLHGAARWGRMRRGWEAAAGERKGAQWLLVDLGAQERRGEGAGACRLCGGYGKATGLGKDC